MFRDGMGTGWIRRFVKVKINDDEDGFNSEMAMVMLVKMKMML